MRILLYISAFLMLSISSLQAQDQQFFETLYDVPVMQGLEEVPDMALSFDKVGGRIAEAGAVTAILSDREVMSFYRASLEQMGWQQKEGVYDPYVFTRENEKLSIFLDKSDSSLVVRFLLEPDMAEKP